MFLWVLSWLLSQPCCLQHFFPVSIIRISEWNQIVESNTAQCAFYLTNTYFFFKLIVSFFKAGKMRVRKHPICFCERSCRCVWPTPWGRWICCRTTCLASPPSNSCRNGESLTERRQPQLAKQPFAGCRIIDSIPSSLFISCLPGLFLKVHAELCGAAGLREQKARGSSHSEWVSE